MNFHNNGVGIDEKHENEKKVIASSLLLVYEYLEFSVNVHDQKEGNSSPDRNNDLKVNILEGLL